MDTKRLEGIKQRREHVLDMWGEDVCEYYVADDVSQLIAEVERLQADAETCEWHGDGGKFVQFYIYDKRSCGEHNGATFKYCPYCGKRIITHPTAAPQSD